MMKKTDKPILFGLLAKSPSNLSASMHNAGFQHLGLNCFYDKFSCEDTKAGLAKMRSEKIKGMSLTIPHKENSIEYLDETSPEVKKIGACNTVINSDGKLSGYNTDYIGVTSALNEVSKDLIDKKALIFGAGGAARAAVFALKEMQIKQIFVTNRTNEKAQRVAEDFGVNYFDIKLLSDETFPDFEYPKIKLRSSFILIMEVI